MRPGPRRSFTHAEILDAAFDLLETKGFAAVSVRGVAGSLGITPTALYTYYSSKNALLRGMIEHLLARLDLREAGGSDTVDVPDAAARISAWVRLRRGPGLMLGRARRSCSSSLWPRTRPSRPPSSRPPVAGLPSG